MKAIFSKKESILLIGLAVVVLLSSVASVFLGLQLHKAGPDTGGGVADPDGTVTPADIQKTETDYTDADFSDKIKDGVLSVADCGAVADSLYDYGALIRSAFRTVINNPGTVLEFEEGVYYVSPVSPDADYTFDFCDDEVQNLHVRGNGCTLMLLDNYVGGFGLKNSKNVVFENMKFDCLEAPFIQGVVTAYDKKANLLTVESDRVNPVFDDSRLEERMQTCFGTIRNKDNPNLLKAEANNYFHFIAVKKLGEKEYQFTLSRQTDYMTNQYIEVGDKIILNSREGETTFIFNIAQSNKCTFKDITIYNSPGGGVCGYQLLGDVTLQNVRMMPNPRSDNWICGSADGAHFQANRGRVIMENCVFANLTDDAMNLYQWEGPINKVVSSTVLEVGSMVTMPKVGDTLEVVDCVTQQIMGTAKIKELLPIPGKRIDDEAQVVLETPITGMNTANVKDTYYYFIKEKSHVGTTVRNSTFLNIRGRGLVLCSTDTVVENCKFQNLSNQVLQAWYGRGEGFEVQNLTFRNNTIENCNYLLQSVDKGLVGQIDIGMANDSMKQSAYISHNKITIADNQFIDYHGCAINIGNARNVVVENNFFDLRTQKYPYTKNNAMYVNVSEDVTIRNNVFNDDSENLTAAIRYQASTVKRLTIQDNTFACEKAKEIIKE